MDCLVGIDIGGTNVKIGIIRTGEQFAVLKKGSIPTVASDPAETIVGGIAGATKKVISEGGQRPSGGRIAEATKKLIAESGQRPIGVGVGCPGLIDPKSGKVKKSPNLPTLPAYGLRDRLQILLGLDVEIQNDANAAALGEFLFGPSR